jgi:hypothetical protein
MSKWKRERERQSFSRVGLDESGRWTLFITWPWTVTIVVDGTLDLRYR